MLTQSRRDEEHAYTQSEWVSHLHIPSTITDFADTLWYIQVLKTYYKSRGKLDAKAMGLATKTIKNFSGLGTFASKNKSLAGMKHFLTSHNGKIQITQVLAIPSQFQVSVFRSHTL